MSEEARVLPRKNAAHIPATSGETVTVACKLPNGVILHLDRFEEYTEPVLGGGIRTNKRAVPIEGAEVRLNGFAIAVHPGALPPEYGIVGGYGLTSGVSKDFWDAWLEANKNSDLVKQNLVFAHVKEEHARGQAREQHKVRSGLEPIDRDNPGSRLPANSRLRIEPGTTSGV